MFPGVSKKIAEAFRINNTNSHRHCVYCENKHRTHILPLGAAVGNTVLDCAKTILSWDVAAGEH